MPVLICMLRGVNVGGHNKVKMETLRALCESLDLRGSRTYIQSGNIVFRAKQKSLPKLRNDLQDAMGRNFGFRPEIILRTIAKLRDAIARNPFAGRRDIEPRKLLVSFLASEPSPEVREKVLQIETAPEELHIDRREIYIYFRSGMARPKLSMPALERTLKIPGTGRNWNTVLKLLEMAEALEAED